MYNASIIIVRIENKWEIYYSIWVNWNVISNSLDTMAGRGRNYLVQGE